MKKEKKLKIAAILAAVAVAASVTVYAAYDSTKDPIVSLSYLEEVFGPSIEESLKESIDEAVGGLKDQILGEIGDGVDGNLSDTVTELKAQIDALESNMNETVSALQEQIDALTNVYEVVELSKNKRIIADASCEIIVISGSVTVRCSDTESGLVDCTDGVILYDGQSAPLYHKLLVPENGDGRGVIANGTAQILVKGGYRIA